MVTILVKNSVFRLRAAIGEAVNHQTSAFAYIREVLSHIVNEQLAIRLLVKAVFCSVAPQTPTSTGT